MPHNWLHYAGTDANGAADLEDAHTLGHQFADAGFHRGLGWAAAEPRPL